eukprot:GHRR01005420.1.p1 GENE.GHRR01005420.1~~GHRR01005420.1.p1  ORF type:complete len:148 (+),score=31.85 GHRR01005420.1:3273-3716(+)
MYWMPLVIGEMLGPDIPNKEILSIALTAVPFVCSAMVQFGTSWHSHRRNERRLHLVAFWAFGTVCLVLMPVPMMKASAAGAFLLLVLAVVGTFGVEGISVSYYLALMGGEKVRPTYKCSNASAQYQGIIVVTIIPICQQPTMPATAC